MTEIRLKHVCRVVETRVRAERPPLLAVSIHHGVVPRSELTDDEPRADDLSAYRQCEAGDIVLNRMRAFQGAVGMAGQRGMVSPDYLVLRPEPFAASRFLHYLFRSTCFVGEMVNRLRGIGSTDAGMVRTPRINSDDLLDIRVELPPLQEQQWIADYLDRETARIDALIAAKEHMAQLADERERVVASNLAVPEGCRFVHLRYLATLQTGLTVDGGRDLGDVSVTRPYLRVANVQAGRLNLTDVTEISVPSSIAARSTLRNGDVVMTEGGDIDKLGRGTVWLDELPGCLHQNHVFAVRPNQAKLRAEYLALLTRSAYARAYFESTGVQSTNLASTSASKIMSLPVPAIAVEDQERLVSAWKQAAEQLQWLHKALSQQIGLLREHRQALVTTAVTGQLEVPVAA